MADEIQVDATELHHLTADLGEVAANIGRYARGAIEHTTVRVRDAWREKASGLEHAPAFPASITYDIKGIQAFGASVVEGEIGPDKGRAQGALGNLIEYGSVNNPAWGIGHAALEENQDDYEQGIDKAVAQSLAVLAADNSIARSAAAIMRGRF